MIVSPLLVAAAGATVNYSTADSAGVTLNLNFDCTGPCALLDQRDRPIINGSTKPHGQSSPALIRRADAGPIHRRNSDKSNSTIQRKSRRSEEHTSELQSPCNLVCRLLLERKN